MNVAMLVFAVAMVLTIALGLYSARGREKGLTEWSVSGRGLGTLFVWLLLAGESYTSYSFLGAAGWSYKYGAPIFYLVAYLGVGYAVAYLVGPLLWTYGRKHGLISISDIAEHRFSSRTVGIVVTVAATLFLLPYIQLQIQGLGTVVTALSGGDVDIHIAYVVAFVVAEGFVLVSGLRGSAWVSVLKDGLVIAVVVFMGVYLPVHFLGGDLVHRLIAEKPDWLTLPGHESPNLGVGWFISTVILNGVTFAIFPNAVAGYLGAKGPNNLRRSAMLLPWYSVLLFVPMAIGFTALFAVPGLKNGDLALFTLAGKAMPEWLFGIVGVAGALSAIVPMSVYMLTIGTMWGKTVLSRTGTSDERKKRLSQLVTLVAGAIALAGSIVRPDALVQLSVLSYEGMAQLAPLVILGLWWRDMTARGAISGLLCGTAIVVILVTTKNDPLVGINAGVIALVVNLIVNVVVSLSTRPLAEVKA